MISIYNSFALKLTFKDQHIQVLRSLVFLINCVLAKQRKSKCLITDDSITHFQGYRDFVVGKKLGESHSYEP